MEHAAQVFPLDLIQSAEDETASLICETPPFHSTFVGIDIGRKRDLRWRGRWSAFAKCCGRARCSCSTACRFQSRRRFSRTRSPRALRRDRRDGIGGPISEHLAERLGEFKLDAVAFTAERKRELFSRAKKEFQAQRVRIPRDARLRDDLASVQRIVTPQGTVKYVARARATARSRATALALAIHASAAVPASR